MRFFFIVKASFFFMSHDIPVTKFRGMKVIVPRNTFNRCEKDVLLLDIVGVWEKLVTALK